MNQSLLLTSIAGIRIAWQSDWTEDMDHLGHAFRYHVIDQEVDHEPCHHVSFSAVFEAPYNLSAYTPVIEGPLIKSDIVSLYALPDGRDILQVKDEIWIEHNRGMRTTRVLLRCLHDNGKVVRPRITDVVVILLHTLMSMYHRYVVHAAAIGIEGKAYVFLGESGHGKSTLSSDMVAMGAEYMGDDLIFLYTENGRVMAGSLLFDTKLIPSPDADHKERVDMISRYNGKPLLWLPVAAFHYISRTDSIESKLIAQDAIDCIAQLLRASNNIRLQYDPDIWQDVCTEAASKIPYYILRYGARTSISPTFFSHVK